MTGFDDSLPLTGRLAITRPSSARRTATASAEQRWSRSYRTRLVLSDSLIVAAAVGGAFLARFGVGSSDLGGLDEMYWLIGGGLVATWMVMLSVFRSRDPRVLGIGAAEYQKVASASFLTFGSLAIVFLVLKVEIARGFFVLTLPIGLAALLLSRWLWRRWITRQRARGHYLSKALIGGSPAEIAHVVEQLERNTGAVYRIVGAAIDGDLADARAGKLGVPVVADLSNLAIAAANLEVDTVILAGQPADAPPGFLRELSWQLVGTATDLVLAADLTDVAGPRIHFRPVEGLPLINVDIPRFTGAKHVLKRALDVVLSGMALAVLSPLFLVLAVLVRLDSSGPAFFSQQRVGRDGTVFTMYKFRSMVNAPENTDLLAGADEGAGVLFKIKADPRITRLGRVIRKYSLDELPQLLNVFVGQMSLVGPRPPLPREVAAYEDRVHRRLFIKPGLTGIWQISGRSDLSWDESVRLDLYYVENWSVAGDLLILVRTAKVLVRPVGAY